jgi:hypothetical protein
LPAVTLILPFCPDEPAVTVIETVPEPDVIAQPVGTVQLYVLAFVTEPILYTRPDVPAHCGVVPVIAPGVAGAAGEVAYVITFELAEVPNVLTALNL